MNKNYESAFQQLSLIVELKRIRLYVYLAILLVSLISGSGYSQVIQNDIYKFNRIDEDFGLTSSTINAITQDTLGFVWIATEDGLHRYDGHEIKVFRRNNKPGNSLPNNYIQQVFVDSRNRIWTLTDYGIGIYNYEKGDFDVILPGTDSLNVQYRSVTSISEFKGLFAIGTFGSGVSLHQNGAFKRLSNNPLNEIDINSLTVSAVEFVNEQKLLIGTWDQGLLLYNLKDNSVSEILPVENDYRVFNIYKETDGAIWVATNLGVVLISGSEVKLIGPSLSEDLPMDDYLSVFATNDHLWIGTRNNGLFRILKSDIAVETNKIIVSRFSNNAGLDGTSSRTVSAIFKDHIGNIWIGTHNGGVNVFNPNGEIVIHLDKDDERKQTLSLSKVWGITEDSQGMVWIGTDGAGIDILNPLTGNVNPFRLNQDLRDKAILCIEEDSEGNMLIGTYRGGLLKYKKGYDQVDGIEGADVRDIRCIELLRDKTVLVGTNGNGLYRIHEDKLELVPSSEFLDVRDIKEGDNQVVWLGTYGNGLVKVHLITGEVSYYNWYADSEQFTPIIQSMYKSENHIWIGSKYSGLVLFDTHTEKFRIFDEEDGLVNNTVRSIIADEKGYLWLSTNNGVTAFDLKNYSFQNFDLYDGFQDGQFNDNSGVLISSGNIAFGGINGLDIFNPQELKGPERIPEIVLSGITILSGNNAPLEINSLPVMNTIELNYDQNFFSVDFSPIDYPFSRKWVVQTKLEGFDIDWTTVGSENNSLLFRGLGYGDYTLKLRVVEGELVGPERVLGIRIIPPFWLRWYAFIFYFVLLVFVARIILRYNARQISLREKLNYEKKLRLQENEVMHRKLRFFTNISHEIRTPLTLISGPIQDLIRKHKTDHESNELLGIINRNGDLLKRLVNRLLEFRKVETEEMSLTVGYYDVSELLMEELESFQYQARSKNITIHFDSPNSMIIWVDIEKLQIILNNLLSNAVKYTDNQGNIWLSAGVDKDYLTVSVKDDGDGLDEKDIKNVFEPFFQGKNAVGRGGTGIGLSLCKRLVEHLQGKITATSILKQGAMFVLQLPATEEAYQEIPGVRFIDSGQIENPQPEIDSINGNVVSNEIDDYILVIADDNEDILTYLRKTFEKEYKVKTAKNGDDALNLVNEVIPDLVISDIMMPGITGLQLCSTIRSAEATSHIPIILLTAKDGSQEKIDGFRAGTDQYVTKPFDAAELKLRVKNLIASRQILKPKLAQVEDDLNEEKNEDVLFLRKVESVVLDNVENSAFSVPELAKELGYSRTSLYRKLKALTGESINHFIRTIRLKKAADMLRDDNATVSSVAFYLGFTDLKYFRTCFKEQYGILPSEYHKNSSRLV